LVDQTVASLAVATVDTRASSRVDKKAAS
jgi:hypothetical protein